TTRDEVTEVSGRGVGLAATRNEVEKLGGSITVSSTPEQGMCITIRLPWLLENTAKLHTETEQSKDSTLVLLDVLKQHTYAYLANEGELEDIRLAPNQADMAAISLNESSVYVRIEAPYEVWVVFYFEQPLLSFLAQTFLDQTESQTSQEDCADMAAELINIIVGLGTQDLNKNEEHSILISTPSMLNKSKSIEAIGSARFYASRIQTQHGDVQVYVMAPQALFDEQLNYLESST
ncbi:MAG: chemotaxis protein CheX, partial [Oleiphilaceae bacterium]|nr:chemotaxis protein CheX [Oleiphilaceae bacterium]